jgi:multiple sugar transport system substrate-binding protein
MMTPFTYVPKRNGPRRSPLLRRLQQTSRKSAIWALGVALVATSCAFFRSSIPQAAAAGTSITVMTVEDPFYFQLTKVLPQFEKATGITVKLQPVSYDAMHARMVNAAVTKSGTFDALTPDSMWISEFVDNGWIVPLDTFIRANRATVQPSDLIPAVVWSLDEWKGHIYTLPVAAYGQDVLYRTDVFQALHLKAPPATTAGSSWWTWDQYMKDVQAINGHTVNGTKFYGTVIAGQQPSPIVHMYTQLAASLGARWFKAYPDSGKWDFTPTINSAVNTKAIAMFSRLYQNSPPQADSMNWFEAGTAFAQGHVGMMYWWTPYNYLVAKAGYEVPQPSPIVGKYGIGVLPHQPGVPQTISIGGYGFAVSSYSQKKAAAFKFIAWATSAKTQLAMAQERGYQFDDFARQSLYRDPAAIAHYPWLPIQLKVMEAGNGKAVRPPIPIYYALEGLYGTALNNTIRGQMTPSAAASSVESEFKSVLGDDGYLPYGGAQYPDTLANTVTLLKRLSS